MEFNFQTRTQNYRSDAIEAKNSSSRSSEFLSPKCTYPAHNLTLAREKKGHIRTGERPCLARFPVSFVRAARDATASTYSDQQVQFIPLHRARLSHAKIIHALALLLMKIAMRAHIMYFMLILETTSRAMRSNRSP